MTKKKSMRCLASAGSVSFLFLGQFYRNSPLLPLLIPSMRLIVFEWRVKPLQLVEVGLHYPFVHFPPPVLQEESVLFFTGTRVMTRQLQIVNQLFLRFLPRNLHNLFPEYAWLIASPFLPISLAVKKPTRRRVARTTQFTPLALPNG